MNNELQERWNHVPNIDGYESSREIFRVVNKKIVNEILKKHTTKIDSMLEIGSGLGELVYNLALEYENQIQQTEQGDKIVLEHKTRHPKSNIIQANVYNIASDLANKSKPNKFEVVLGYSSFDTMLDLESALKNVKDITNEQGLFIHFLDLKASFNTFFNSHQNNGTVLFPYFEQDEQSHFMHNIGLQEVEKKDLDKLKEFASRLNVNNNESMKEGIIKLIELYAKNPEYYYVKLYNHKDPSEGRRMLSILSNLVVFSSVNSKRIIANDEFKKHLEKTLESNGYQILESKVKGNEIIIPSNDATNKYPQIKYFYNNVGYIENVPKFMVFSNHIKEGEVGIASSLYVVVAQKLSHEQRYFNCSPK